MRSSGFSPPLLGRRWGRHLFAVPGWVPSLHADFGADVTQRTGILLLFDFYSNGLTRLGLPHLGRGPVGRSI